MSPEYISLSFWLTVWDWVEASGTFIVAVAIYGEYLKEYKKYPKDEHCRENFGKACVWVLIGGVCIELLAHSMGSHINGRMVAISNHKLSGAIDDAASATALAAETARTNVQLSIQLEGLKSNNLVLQSNLLELAANQAPRIFRNQLGAAKRLGKFAGTKIFVVSGADDESIRTADQIKFVLSEAQWVVMSPDNSFDVEPFIGRREGVTVVSRIEDWKLGGRDAPKSLRKELSEAGLLGEWRAVPEGLPTNTFAVQVGRKPDPTESKAFQLSDALVNAAEEGKTFAEIQAIIEEMTKLRALPKGLTNFQVSGSYNLPAPKSDSRTNSGQETNAVK